MKISNRGNRGFAAGSFVVFFLAFALSACRSPSGHDQTIIPVTDITGVPNTATAGIPLTLTGTVAPDNATNKSIVWSVTNAGTTGASITGNTLNTTAAGTVTVTATIADGMAVGTPYTKNFSITVNAGFVPVTGISGVPDTAIKGTPLTLTGTVAPSNATNKTIVWSTASIGATINGNTLNTTTRGTVTITATIANGKAADTPYTQNFSITVTAPDVMYTAAQIDGSNFTATTTGISFTFNESIDDFDLTVDDITVNGAAGTTAETKLTGAGTAWTLSPIEVKQAELATVKINKPGIEAVEKELLVYKQGENISGYASVSWHLDGGDWEPGSHYHTFIQHDTALDRPAPDPHKEHYTFGGWYSDEHLSSAYNFASMVTDDLNLYARWTINQYTVTFDINQGSGTVPAAETVNYNTNITLPDETGFTRTGYTFGGWNTDSSGAGTHYNAGASYTVIGNITLCAKWNINQYTVTFNPNGGNWSGDTANKTQQADWNTTVDEPDEPSKVSCTFNGWYTENSAHAWNFDTPVSADITLYAQWVFDKDVLASWLLSQPDGMNSAEPIYLPLEIDLGDMTEADSDWYQLLAAIDKAGKFVDLDLSDCTLTGTTFNTSIIDYIKPDGMDKIASIVLPDSVETIGDRAFLQCTGLTSVTIPDSVTSIGNEAFTFCSNLESVTIPDSVETIGNYAFNYCTGLTSVTIGSGVTSIGMMAFGDCTGLESVTIGDSVTSIGVAAFYQCTSLESVSIPDSVETIAHTAFYHCTSLTSVTIPDSVTIIGGSAFNYCSKLTSVTIGSGVTSIGNNAFERCSSLTSIDIPAGVETIDNYAFNYCDNLTSVTIGSGVTSIGNYAFANCSGLTSVTCLPETPPTLGTAVFVSTSPLIKVPGGSVEAYKTSWSYYASRISAIE